MFNKENSSDFLVFVDEAGDHNLEKWDNEFPLFVLAYCIINKEHYCDFVLPRITKIKLKYFNRTDVILHERDIRKQTGCFSCLTNKDIQNEFMNDITQLMRDTQFTIISCVINKPLFKGKYKNPMHPYHLANSMCLDRLCHFLEENNSKKKTVITFEARGNKEDCDLRNNFETRNNLFDINITPKANNCVGLQFADLVARPIGRFVMNPEQQNRSLEIIKTKLRCDTNGNFYGRGLKIFP